jgi:urea transport system substrate-binding protein
MRDLRLGPSSTPPRATLRHRAVWSLVTLMLGSAFLATSGGALAITPEPIKIGILYSLSGTMAISERSLVDAVLLAVREINEDGGVLGRPIQPIIEDAASDWPTSAQKADKLIRDDRVSSVFGCWTSACRKAVLPVVERQDNLLWYAVQYEGNESSRNVIYGGATPNQQIVPALRWFTAALGRRKPYLIGSDYVFPHAANDIIKRYLKTLGIEPVGESYHRLGDRNFVGALRSIRETGADCVLNTLNGDSNVGFFWEFG